MSLLAETIKNATVSTTNDSNSSVDADCIVQLQMPDKTMFILTAGAGVAICSVCCNIFLLYLFVTRPKFRQSHLLYLAVLAMVDVLLGTSYLLLMVTPELSQYLNHQGLQKKFMSYFIPLATPSMCLLTVASYLVVMATVERFFKTMEGLVVFFHFPYHFVKSNRWKMIFLCFLIGAIVRGTYPFEVRVYRKEACIGLFYETDIMGLLLLNSTQFHQFWTFYLRNTVHVFIPFFTLLVMNTVILITLRKDEAEARRSSLGRSGPGVSRNHSMVRDATRMLLATVAMYLASNTLSVVISTSETLADRYYLYMNYTRFYLWGNDLTSFSTILCGCIRLPVYCLCNTDIRHSTASIMKKILFCAACQKGDALSDYQLSTMVMTTGNGTVTRKSFDLDLDGQANQPLTKVRLRRIRVKKYDKWKK